MNHGKTTNFTQDYYYHVLLIKHKKPTWVLDLLISESRYAVLGRNRPYTKRLKQRHVNVILIAQVFFM